MTHTIAAITFMHNANNRLKISYTVPRTESKYGYSSIRVESRSDNLTTGE